MDKWIMESRSILCISISTSRSSRINFDYTFHIYIKKEILIRLETIPFPFFLTKKNKNLHFGHFIIIYTFAHLDIIINNNNSWIIE